MPNPLMHIELNSTDPAKAREFNSQLVVKPGSTMACCFSGMTLQAGYVRN